MLLAEEATDEKVRLGALELMAKYSDGIPRAVSDESEESEQSDEKTEAKFLKLLQPEAVGGEEN